MEKKNIIYAKHEGIKNVYEYDVNKVACGGEASIYKGHVKGEFP
jgi:hypothetical protein